MTKSENKPNLIISLENQLRNTLPGEFAQKIMKPKYLTTKNKNYMLDNFDDNFLEIIYLRNILYCQNFCESNHIEYYFTLGTARSKTKMQGSLEKYRDSIRKHINWKNIFLAHFLYSLKL